MATLTKSQQMSTLFNRILLVLTFTSTVNGGPTCDSMEPICTSDGLSFSVVHHDGSVGENGPNYGCLGSTPEHRPDPAWFYLKISTAGNIYMSLTALEDIDHIIYGPYDDEASAQAECASMGQNEADIVDCSYDTTNHETPQIIGAEVGQVYVMLITNYAKITQDISLVSTSQSTGATNCRIVPTENPTVGTASPTRVPTTSPTSNPTEFEYDHMDIGCNYVNFNGFASPIDKCESLTYGGDSSSYVYKCNDYGSYPDTSAPIVMLYYFNSSDCTGTNSEVVDATSPYADDITDYVCTYNSSTNDECIDNQLTVRRYTSDPETNMSCIHDTNWTEMETQIINKCVKAFNSEDGMYDAFAKYECNGDNVLIDYFADAQCQTLIGSNVSLTNDECIDGKIIRHSCPMMAPELDCDYVNYDGFASRVDICHPAPHQGSDLEFYALQCHEHNTNDTSIALNWWGKGGCNGDPIQTYPLDIGYDIIDYHCGESGALNTCPSSDVLILKVFADDNCYKSEESYTIVDMVTNTCTRDGVGGSQRVLCDMDDRGMSNDMGYKIQHYSDENCQLFIGDDRHSEVECRNGTGNLEFVVWCNGPNEIEYLDNKCEYHINSRQMKPERKYLIHALEKCSEFKLANGYFSNKYVCNAEGNGVTEVWYKGRKCYEPHRIATYEFDVGMNNFNCYQGQKPMNDELGCSADDNLMTLRWYSKDPLTSEGDCMKKKGYYEDNQIITGICAPDFVSSMNGEMVYTKIDCDDRDLKGFEIGFYADPGCTMASRLHRVLFKSGQCFDGDIIDVMGCKGKGYDFEDYITDSMSSSEEVLPIVVNENDANL